MTIEDQDLTEVRRSLTAVLGSLDDVRLDTPAQAVLARGRARRLRRGLAAVTAAGGALALTLALALPSGGQPGDGRAALASPSRLVHVQLAAWSVTQNADGTVLLTLHELKDAAALQHVLARAGVPSVVRFDQNCRADRNRSAGHVIVDGRPGLMIRPSAIPKGWKLNLDLLPVPSKHNAAFAFGLVPDGAHLICSAP